MDARVLAALARGGGLVTARTLRELGIDPRLVATWVRQQQLLSVWRGVYTTPEVWEGWDKYHDRPLARIRSARLVARAAYVFSHDSSAIVQRLSLIRPQDSAVHMTRTELRGSRTTTGIHHHGARYRPDQVREVDGLRVLDLARTAIDIAREHGYRAGLVAADGAMQLAVSRTQLREAAAAMAGWPHSLVLEAVITDADPGAESVAETLGRELAVEAGLGPIETQFPVRIGRGVAWIDMRVGCHGIEVDGMKKIQPPDEGGVADRDAHQVLWDERKRQHLVCAEGLGISRLTWNDFWGSARERAKERLRAEYAVTRDRFGTELPAHLAEFARVMRGRRYRTPA